MLKDKEMNQIKIIDFGMAKEIVFIFLYCFSYFRKNLFLVFHSIEREYIVGIVGTVSYMSPDILNGYYTCKTDMWSVGVMLFVMVSGNFVLRFFSSS